MAQDTTRGDRLAAALRANLRRRKAAGPAPLSKPPSQPDDAAPGDCAPTKTP